MGFGLLFLGYLLSFLMSLNAYGYVFAILGYYIIFCALQKLSEYKHSFSYALLPLCIMTVLRVLELIVSVSQKTGLDLYLASVIERVLGLSTISVLIVISSFVFLVLVFISITEIADSVELPELVKKGRFNIALRALYILIYLFALLLPVISNVNTGILMPVLLIFELVCHFLALSLIYKCFFKICAPEDVDMPIKPSKFKFINDIRAKKEEKAEELRKANEEILNRQKSSSPKKKKKK